MFLERLSLTTELVWSVLFVFFFFFCLFPSNCHFWVLYQMFRKFTLIGADHLSLSDYLAGMASFAVIALGGTLIGLLFALLASILTRPFQSRPNTDKFPF